MQAKVASSYLVTTKLDEVAPYQKKTAEKLWNFYLESEFIYPEKLNILLPYKKEIINTLKKMLLCKNETFKFIFVISKNKLVGSIMAAQFTDKTWLIQHLSILPEYRLGPVAKILLLSINEWMLNNPTMHYFQNYFRQKTKIAYKTFQGMFQNQNSSQYMSLETMDYFTLNYQNIPSSLIQNRTNIEVYPLKPTDQEQVYQALCEENHPIFLSTIGIEVNGFFFKSIVENFRELGLYRERKYLVAVAEKKILGLAVLDASSTGVNLSHFFAAAIFFIFNAKMKSSTISALTNTLVKSQIQSKTNNLILLAKPNDRIIYDKMGYKFKRTYMQYNLSSTNNMFRLLYEMIANHKKAASMLK